VSKWGGKYVIGLTGNIGTGKSVVRRMLEHIGAYGIDADALAHRAIAKGAPGYRPVVETFGKWVLGADGEINRQKLGSLVFANPAALKELERIVHPLVGKAVEIIASRAKQDVVVIEAIKLLETDLRSACDSIWVTYASPEIQLRRLMHYRKMTAEEARTRIQAQPPQEEKIKAANVLIKNVGTFEDTWFQVLTAWKKAFPAMPQEAEEIVEESEATAGEIQVIRGKPKHSAEIAELINKFNKGEQELDRNDIMAAFGEKAFLLVKDGSAFQGVIGWQVENLVSRTVDIVFAPKAAVERILPPLMDEMEKASKDLQCEASLVFVPDQLKVPDQTWRDLGYKPIVPEKLGVIAWQEAAQESMPAGTKLYFKQLRKDRILRPI